MAVIARFRRTQEAPYRAACAGNYATHPNQAHLAGAIARQTNVAQAITAAQQELPVNA